MSRSPMIPIALGLLLLAGCSAAPAASSPPPAGAVNTPVAGTPAQPTSEASPMSAACGADFDAFNVEKDTFLSYDEYVEGKYGRIRYIKAPTPEEEAATRAGLRREAVAADANQDGKLSREEFATTCR